MKILRNLCLAAILLATATTAQAAPRYIFYFIGDGMGMAPVMAAEAYNRLVKADGSQLTMTGFPHAGWLQTWSASSPVTDSAAAGTALATGHKTNNGMLGMNADTVAVYSVAKALHDNGWGIGIVTNGAADDATPGAFYAHQPNRGMFYEIGCDAAASGYDFIAGAGLRGTRHKDGTDNGLYDVLAQSGIQILRGAEGARAVAESTSRRIMLLNNEGYADPNEMGFNVDGVGSDGIGLTLPIAMQACMTHLLKNSPDRFFMMVEGAQIDHALHGNDGAAAILDIFDFDNCIAMAYEFYKQHPDETLIVVTADHDTGGMSVGCSFTGYNAYPKYVDLAHTSKNAFSDYCQGLLKSDTTPTWDDMKAYLEKNLGLWSQIKVSDKQTKELQDAFDESFVQRRDVAEKGLYKTSMGFASKVFKVYNDCSGWGFTTGNHTGNPVPVFAVGVGADFFGRMHNNTDIAPELIRLATE